MSSRRSNLGARVATALRDTPTNDAGAALLSQQAERFQSVVIDDGLVVLSAMDDLPVGDDTPLGSDLTANASVSVYAEQLTVSGTVRLCSGVVSAKAIVQAGNAVLSTRGADGPPTSPLVRTTADDAVPSNNGGTGGNLSLYVESLDGSGPGYTIDASGGEGGPAQSGGTQYPGGNGGDGGDGGDVVALVAHPKVTLADALAAIYRADTTQKSLTRDLGALVQANATVDELQPITQALSAASVTVSSLQAAIGSAVEMLRANAGTARQLLAHSIDVDQGAYGVYGGGNPNGTDGSPGKAGTRRVVLGGAMSLAAAAATIPPATPAGSTNGLFMWAHPSQCMMMMERIKLLYLTADPTVANSIQDTIILLLRLQRRTAPFVNLAPDSPIATYYAQNENQAGAIGSIATLQRINEEATTYLSQLKQGLDIFGHTSQWVPSSSFTFLKADFDERIGYFAQLEAAYETCFANLQKNQASMDQIEAARGQAQQIISQATNDLTALRQRQVSEANIIQGYITLLDGGNGLRGMKADVEQAIDSFSSQLPAFDFDLKSLLGALGAIAFMPESAMTWITQGAQYIQQATTTLVDDHGEQVQKAYLVAQVQQAGTDLQSLSEQYSSLDDGTLQPDDPGATKLLAVQAELKQQLDPFYSKLGAVVPTLEAKFQQYVDAVTSRNTHIIAYNATVLLMVKAAAEIDRANQRMATLTNQALAALAADSPDLTSYVSNLYYTSRAQIIAALDATARAYRFWALSDRPLLQEALGNSAPPAINSAVLTSAADQIASAYTAAVEDFGTKMQQWGAPITITLSDDEVTMLKALNGVYVRVPPAMADTTIADSPFAGKANVRITNVEVYVTGAQVDGGQLTVNITHMGNESVIDTTGNQYDFEHQPIEKEFTYDVGTNGVTTPAAFGSLDGDLYGLVGPFAQWHIQVSTQNNAGLSLDGVTGVTICFLGGFYPFPVDFR